MSIIFGNIATRVSSSALASGVAWASVAAAQGTSYQLLGFSGGETAMACVTRVYFGSNPKFRYYTRSGAPVNEWFGDLGPITTSGEALVVRTNTPGSTGGQPFANLLYRVVL